jgi:hypothetical protein
MVLKIIVTIIFVLFGLLALRLVSGDTSARVTKRKTERVMAERRKNSEPMVRCARCDAWHTPGETCDCSSS